MSAPASLPATVPETAVADVPTKAPVVDFTKTFEIRWADCDPNQHLRHSAYTDYATHVRFNYIEAQGFPLKRFEEEGIGPVIFREEVQFLREVRHNETITVNFKVGAFSDDGTRWSVFHEVKNQRGKRAAVIVLEGGWLDIESRKLRAPPADLKAIMDRLPSGKIPSYRFLR